MSTRIGLMDNYSAVGMEEKDTVEVVGYLCWYSVGMKLISRNMLREYITLSGVDERYMPNEIRVPDAFRRATKAIECKQPLETGSGSVSYLVREVISSKEKVQRNIVKEVINSNADQPLRYNTEEAVIILDKENDNMIHTSIYNEEVRNMVERATQLFELYKTTHDDHAIRAMCVNVIKGMSPVLVKTSGGVYFVPIKYESELRAFNELVNLLEQSDAHMIPLIKTKDTIDLVRKSTIRQLNESFERLKTAFEDENTPASEITAVVENCELSFKVIEDYKELLTSDLLDVENSLAGMQRMLRSVASRKKDRKPKNDAIRQLRLFD